MIQRRPIITSILFTILIAMTASAAAKVSIKEWDLPTPKSFPHDPAVGIDGSLWYTGMASNTLGRLDPATGMIKEYRLTTPDSGPHGITPDKDGNIWFTANYKGYIGKLDPQTGKFRSIPCPTARQRTRIPWFSTGRAALVYGSERQLYRPARPPDRGHYTKKIPDA